MNPVRKNRLRIVLYIVFGSSLAAVLGLMALDENMNYFYSPVELAAGKAPVDKTIRGGGLVVVGSHQRDTQSLANTFSITDGQAIIKVHYTGILPDLFREGQGVIAVGKLNASGELMADQVLAKHDENYMPPEVEGALKQAGHPDYSSSSSPATVTN
ncbi:cytochrome c maturation protein CcmE [Zooshikella marina]|uniref:cytochrome c maturation protein CcmE n=1 Tax=Zooshikella ganghwensis TaxID=202772 RepID=UPI001BB05DFC|nr:cytochrome c maturation protein CcmE [Zooshikella ganghwensis]MBU2707090.1 cytochrome c maturation protein CcmE [Zooshikella ganghwensis]